MGTAWSLRPAGRCVSDRELRDEDLTVDGEVGVIRALLDELGAERVRLFGSSSGGCAAIAFAARFERVERLAYGSYAEGPSITPPAVREAIVTTVRSHWGIGSRLLSDIFLGEVSSQEQERFARFQRLATSADAAAALLEQVYRNDVRDQLPLVKAPDGRPPPRGSRDPYRLGREVAAGITGATLVPLEERPTSRGPAMPIAWSGAARGRRPRGAHLASGRRRAGGGTAVATRARGAQAPGARAHRPRDRPAADRESPHGAPPRGEHPSQARPRISDGGGRRSGSPGTALNRPPYGA